MDKHSRCACKIVVVSHGNLTCFHERPMYLTWLFPRTSVIRYFVNLMVKSKTNISLTGPKLWF